MTDNNTLYDPAFEHDSCGIGFTAHLDNQKSHSIVANALVMLENMEHRGAVGADPLTGDGSGILVQIPHEFFKKETENNFDLPAEGKYGAGTIFFPRDKEEKLFCKEYLIEYCERVGVEILGYRKVPVREKGIGTSSLYVSPGVEQLFVKLKDETLTSDDLERKLYVLRRSVSYAIKRDARIIYDFYFPSFSTRTIIYKGQLTTNQLKSYFPDLSNARFKSALAMVHSRFSTNTFPKWRLAQPFRFIAHNGEINTIRGNVNRMKYKEMILESGMFTQEEFSLLRPICHDANSDSANLDAVVELLVMSGRTLPHVMMMMIPETWIYDQNMDEKKKDFYKYFASLMEPWDGPASICFTDGKIIGATLDRNGLRPSRFCITEDRQIIMASEAGVLPVDESKIIEKGRLQSGRMFVADLSQGRILDDKEIKDELCEAQPYGKWLEENLVEIGDHKELIELKEIFDERSLQQNQQVFGITAEDIKMILIPMAHKAIEPVGSMGADNPLAVLSQKSQHLSNYFKQLFAQVSNPPIDPIREKSVMALFTRIGEQRNILEETPEHCRQIHINQPVLTKKEFNALKNNEFEGFRSGYLKAGFKSDGKEGRLQEGLDKLCKSAERAIKDGKQILIISNRKWTEDIAPIPSLIALATVHHHLLRKRLLHKAGLIVEAGDALETHHFATLIGYGASAVYPFLSLESLISLSRAGEVEGVSEGEALNNYIAAINYGLLKILSKMGISTMQAYQGAQIFEAIGLNKEVVDHSFSGTTSRLEGIGFDGIAKEALVKHGLALTNIRELDPGGFYQWNRRGEAHLFNPETIHLLQKSTRINSYELYKKFAEKINEQNERAVTLRSLFDFKTDRKSIPLEKVEPAENILKRFATGAMSFGSLSYEAHATLAVAMNRIGAKSNSGEGGEDEVRFEVKPNGDWERSAIKQVASGRFGVTSNYLANASELQIKMAQGAKPGEGGQLPGHKVDDWIGRVRSSTPGVGLISPPPHHDIYSIEDLAQLIYDLKNANRDARVNVKLVAEAGVGTIAAGVAKAHADAILIAGHDGGTGASPISSVHHAGIPWELGLSEAQQTLVKNNLRSRVVLQTDGQLRTGRDIAIATLLGAEEWGISTAALVVEGCILTRKCHLNTCPVGVATQNPELRKKFTGNADHVVNYFRFITEELREIMAELGFKTINEMVGQANTLKTREDLKNWKHQELNLDPIFYKYKQAKKIGIYHQKQQDHALGKILDWKLIKKAQPALNLEKKVEEKFKIINTDRAVGTMLSHEISKKFGSKGLEEDSLIYNFTGSAGQSFGAFLTQGVTFNLEGEANDYFGKGLSGGKLIVKPNKEAKFDAAENIIIGNVAFYGGTSGEAYIRGMAGERFCVRNSGVSVVVETIGDHGCEYMTGGKVAVLGQTGKNFAAGMSGGKAYIYDPYQNFLKKCNMEMVDLDPLDLDDIADLKDMIRNHFSYTGSETAKRLLNNWNISIGYFIKVMPRDYKAALLKNKESLKKVV